MSHWKKFTANVLENINEEMLAKAAADLNVQFDKNITSIRNTWGREAVSAGLIYKGTPIALGFNFKERNGNTALELSGDFYGTGLDERSFINQLAQAYQKHNAVEKLEEQGWVVESIEFNKKNEIEIEAYQWA